MGRALAILHARHACDNIAGTMVNGNYTYVCFSLVETFEVGRSWNFYFWKHFINSRNLFFFLSSIFNLGQRSLSWNQLESFYPLKIVLFIIGNLCYLFKRVKFFFFFYFSTREVVY